MKTIPFKILILTSGLILFGLKSYGQKCKSMQLTISQIDSTSSMDYSYGTLITNDSTHSILWWNKSEEFFKNIKTEYRYTLKVSSERPYNIYVRGINMPYTPHVDEYYVGYKEIVCYRLCPKKKNIEAINE